ncbi:hypothetical protein GWK47_044009 [Chionoecetes opilio]|uniref:Uncharacterized protein n=1 Tax=Chionoecetes opilio TaxID=41210 RepID=A0A8J5CZB2_CHIOP|nr:hypothetical protein GWK47_044009 [Chionoecetes opilio]
MLPLGIRAGGHSGYGNVPETFECFLLQCPRFHSHRVVLRSQLLALNVTTFDLPTLLAVAGVCPSWQHAVIRLTCAFLKKTDFFRREQARLFHPIGPGVLRAGRKTQGRRSTAFVEFDGAVQAVVPQTSAPKVQYADESAGNRNVEGGLHDCL